MIYVLDTSVVARLSQAVVVDRIEAVGQPNCKIPTVVLLEMGRVAQNSHEYRELMDWLTTSFTEIVASPWAHEETRHLQERLLLIGAHRSASVADLMVAALAVQERAVVLHYDRDFDTLSKATGVRSQWIAPAGTLDHPTSG